MDDEAENLPELENTVQRSIPINHWPMNWLPKVWKFLTAQIREEI